MLVLTLDQDSVGSPDTLTGLIRAEDSDGVDSVWLTGDGTTLADDGLLETSYANRFRLPIQAGHLPGVALPIALRGRDVGGFTHQVRDTVWVK